MASANFLSEASVDRRTVPLYTLMSIRIRCACPTDVSLLYNYPEAFRLSAKCSYCTVLYIDSCLRLLWFYGFSLVHL